MDYYASINQFQLQHPDLWSALDRDGTYAAPPENEGAAYQYLALNLEKLERLYLMEEADDRDVLLSSARWLGQQLLPSAMFDRVWEADRCYYSRDFVRLVDVQTGQPYLPPCQEEWHRWAPIPAPG